MTNKNTRNTSITVATRFRNDPLFAQALVNEIHELYMNGESEIALGILQELLIIDIQ